MEFLDVRLALQIDAVAEMQAFYAHDLGFAEQNEGDSEDLVSVRIGQTLLRFGPAAPGDKPFYHFALLAPSDRFEAARAWLADRSDLLRDPDTGDDIFDFDDWAALACYCLDPVGNILEVIAHRGLGVSGASGYFQSREMFGFSEVGLVVPNKVGAASQLTRETGLEVWDGEVDDPQRLAFLGERGRTFILAPPGRGWLPTDRPAEPHAVDVVISGSRTGLVEIEGTGHTVESRPS